MTATDIISATTITAVWVGLGGDPPEHGRARAFYRNGDNPQAVAINEAKGCWYDYRDQSGGGILALVQRVLGCDRTAALRRLAEFTGLSLENHTFTPRERRDYALRCIRAQQLALEVSDFERGLGLWFERHQENAGAVIQWLLSLGLDDLSEIFAGAASGLAVLRKADADSLVALYRNLPEAVRRPFRAAGRRDREHAEAMTGAIITMLARAAQVAEAAP